MRKLLLAVLLLSCDPQFVDCPNCRTDEDSAESVDGTEQVPIVVVNVNVNVDQSQTQDQDQGQIQGQGQGQSNTNTNTNTNNNGGGSTPVVDAGTPDAGTKPDAGTPKVDAGTPPKPDAGKPDAGTCRKVCVCYEVRYVCKVTKKDTNKKSDCTCGVEKQYNKCTKEETKCQ